MKTTNMNNNANTPAITEIKYISNYKEIRNEDGGSRINIQATLCNSVDVALSSYMFSVWGDVLVTNITTGEECVYNHLELKAWCSTLTLDELANYHMRRVRDYGESSHIAEYYFTVINEADKVDDEKNPLWKLEVCNVDTGELIESRCFSSIRNMVEYADTHLLNWRYPRSGKVNCAFYANGYNITKHFEAQSRKNYTLDTDSGWNHVLYVRAPIEECTSAEETVENAAETYICSICGKEHSVQSGRFNPWPVRMPAKVDGERNYCCTSCYEQYVSTMYKFMFTVSFLHGVDEKFNKYPENQEGYIRMLSGMTTEELDSLVEEEHLREQNVMFCLRFLEANRAKEEKKRIKEEERKARARERARERRAAAKAAKLAGQETE